MQHQNCLGIYLAKDSATAVLLSGHGQKPAVLNCFRISTEPDAEQIASLPSTIAQKVSARGFNVEQVSVAIDCTFFTQHNLHSEFTDQKQIASTIKFDAEDALATDATELAVAFEITNTDQAGSDITIYTSERPMLTDMLLDLQANNIDPIAMEPDIVCLARFLRQNLTLGDDENPLIVILSENSCYMINFSKSQKAPASRSFLLSTSQNKTNVLASQIPLTIASFKSDLPIDSLILAGRIENIDYDMLAERTALVVKTIDLPDTTHADKTLLADCPETDFAIAYGAALAVLPQAGKIDFRADFMPYAGKKLLMQKTLRVISVSLAILMIALGTYFQSQVFMNKKNVSRLREKIENEYSAAMYGKKPHKRRSIAKSLKDELTRVKKLRETGGDENSVPAKLTYILEAINSAPPKIDIKVNTLTISEKTMRIIGDTKSRSATLALFKSIKNHPKLKKSNENLEAGSRDSFTVDLELKEPK